MDTGIAIPPGASPSVETLGAVDWAIHKRIAHCARAQWAICCHDAERSRSTHLVAFRTYQL